MTLSPRSWIDDRRLPILAPILLVVAIAISLFPNRYVVHVAVLVAVYIMLAMGLSVVVGLAGLLDLGYVAFYAVGAYGYAILNIRYDLGFWPAVAVCWMPAALVGVVLGLPTLRVRGDYLALVTLGLGEIIRLLLLNLNGMTNGPRGLMGIDGPFFFGSPVTTPREYLWVGILFAGVATTVAYRIRFARTGLALLAVRDDEAAAASVGLVPVTWRLFAFAVGAGIAGVAGVFFAAWQRFVSPNSFTLLESVLVLSIVVLAGFGRLLGLMASATFFVAVPEVLRGFSEGRLFAYGALLAAVVVLQERRRQRELVRRRVAVSRPSAALRRAADDARSGPRTEIAFANERRQPNGTLVEIVGLTKSFGGLTALKDVSLVINHGELIGLIGPNGAGKSTLFHCLRGGAQPTSGSIRLFTQSGPVPGSRTPWAGTRGGIAGTFQDARLFPSLTALENVIVALPEPVHRVLMRPFLGGRRRERSVATRSALELLDAVGVAAGDQLAGDLPLAIQKRVAVARALATRPSLLLLDEPAAGMSSEERTTFAEELRGIRAAFGITMVIVEHDPAFIYSLASRVIVLDQGRVVADGPPAVIDAEHNVHRVYLGESAPEAPCSR